MLHSHVLIAMAGLPAAGKSTIARNLKIALNAVLLDKDQVRAQLFAGRVDYTRKQDDLCVNIMYDVASYHFANDDCSYVILDGRTYSKYYQIEAVKQAASRAGVSLCIIECICSAKSAKFRLEKDSRTHIAKDRNFDLYLRSCASADPIEEMKLTLNTDNHNEAECTQFALDYIRKQTLC